MNLLPFIEDYLSDQKNGMKNLITGFLNRVMLAEALQQAGAAQYEHTDARKAHRNGYKDRSLNTRYGDFMIWKPQFREFPFEAQVFGRYARVEIALVNAISESYPQGVSTRRIQEIVSHLDIDQLSPVSVSQMVKDLDDLVRAFFVRPIEQAIPYLFVDVSYYRVRDDVRYVTKAALMVVGVREDDYRENLHARATNCENEEFWSGFFEDLKEQSLTDVQLTISDGY